MTVDKIGVDIDGVIANFHYHFSLAVRKVHGLKYPIMGPDDSEYWDLGKKLELTQEQIDQVWAIIKPKFWYNLFLIDIDDWTTFKTSFHKNKNYIVYFITSRIPLKRVFENTYDWFSKYKWKGAQIIFSTEKHKVINALGVKYFIDDMSETCESAAELCPDCKVFLMNRSYNEKTIIKHSNIKRVFNLKEFSEEIILGGTLNGTSGMGQSIS